MKAVTAAEMREIDRVSIEEYLIPDSLLMNNAGRAVADFIISNTSYKKADIFCGTGNNGGDGFTAAWYLRNSGIDPVIYISGSKEKITPVSLVFLKVCEKLGIKTIYLDESNIQTLSIRSDSIIIDSLTGTGFGGVLNGIPQKIVKLINSSPNEVLSVDIPSGLPSDGTAPDGDAVRADITLTIGLPKISLVTWPGKEYCGRLVVADIGFPSELTGSSNLKVDLIDEELMKSINFSAVSDDIHKGDKGNTLIVGGMPGMEGAALLTASAMFRTGTGLVTVATSEESRKIIAGKLPELMTVSVPEKADVEKIDALLKAKKYTGLIIGPGLGRGAYSESLFTVFIDRAAGAGISRVLIDGDGLYHLAAYLKQKKLPAGIKFIITPHFMEASRLSGLTVDEIRNNRLRCCVELSRSTGCITVLKGPGTIVSDGDTSCINTTGNRALATAGSGDVLSGIVGALFNRISEPYHAASAGVFIHGLSADIYKDTYSRDSMSASDILDYIRPALKRIP